MKEFFLVFKDITFYSWLKILRLILQLIYSSLRVYKQQKPNSKHLDFSITSISYILLLLDVFIHVL